MKQVRRSGSADTTRRGFLCAAGALAAEGAAALRIDETEGEKLTVLHGSRPLLEYRYDRARPKPYVHPLYLPDGTPLTLDGPKDHIHHRGLMVAWSAVNGYDFWGEVNPAPHGQSQHVHAQCQRRQHDRVVRQYRKTQHHAEQDHLHPRTLVQPPLHEVKRHHQ